MTGVQAGGWQCLDDKVKVPGNFDFESRFNFPKQIRCENKTQNSLFSN